VEVAGPIVLLSQRWQLIGNVLGRAASAKLGEIAVANAMPEDPFLRLSGQLLLERGEAGVRVSDVWGNRAVVRSALTSQCPSS